ncbi:hypothetical protein E2C01_048375 [Portunus trituberculatus]|uniref:Uncharacterized protein n=1 Tax=Portunus trituberculatus TaxID=210409 RepID=A0A5B7GBE8_PORTR|nr:hypothetical protein [Portunus trituberculatus]
MLTNIRVAFQYLDKDEYNTSKVGICSSGAVAELEKGYKIRTDPEDSYKGGAGTKGPNIQRMVGGNGTANLTR